MGLHVGIIWTRSAPDIVSHDLTRKAIGNKVQLKTSPGKAESLSSDL